jgi:hypothetical protein
MQLLAPLIVIIIIFSGLQYENSNLEKKLTEKENYNIIFLTPEPEQ